MLRSLLIAAVLVFDARGLSVQQRQQRAAADGR